MLSPPGGARGRSDAAVVPARVPPPVVPADRDGDEVGPPLERGEEFGQSGQKGRGEGEHLSLQGPRGKAVDDGLN
jgi:hypothetical protein